MKNARSCRILLRAPSSRSQRCLPKPKWATPARSGYRIKDGHGGRNWHWARARFGVAKAVEAHGPWVGIYPSDIVLFFILTVIKDGDAPTTGPPPRIAPFANLSENC